MNRTLWAFVGACVVSVAVSAQTSYPQGKDTTSPTTSEPTTQAPSTTPPTTPARPAAAAANADKKVTFSGCIERQPPSAAAVTGGPNMPFMLTGASAVGAGAAVGTAGAATGAPTGAASATVGKSYRLDGAESTLSPHVGHKVEITGTIQEQPASPAASATVTGPATAAAARLKVDSLKMVSTTCP